MRTVIVVISVGLVLGSRFDWDPDQVFSSVLDEPTFLDESVTVETDEAFQAHAASVTYEESSSSSARADPKSLSVSLIGMNLLHSDWRVPPAIFHEQVRALLPDIPFTPENASATLSKLRQLCAVPEWIYVELTQTSTEMLTKRLHDVIENIVSIGTARGCGYGNLRLAAPVVVAWVNECIMPERTFQDIKFSKIRKQRGTGKVYRSLSNEACENVMTTTAVTELGQIAKRRIPDARSG